MTTGTSSHPLLQWMEHTAAQHRTSPPPSSLYSNHADTHRPSPHSRTLLHAPTQRNDARVPPSASLVVGCQLYPLCPACPDQPTTRRFNHNAVPNHRHSTCSDCRTLTCRGVGDQQLRLEGRVGEPPFVWHVTVRGCRAPRSARTPNSTAPGFGCNQLVFCRPPSTR